MYQVLSSTMSVMYMHIRISIVMYCSRLFVVVFQEIHLNMMFVGSLSFISLPSFVFVIAPVSELCEWNQNKEEEKNSKIDYFQFRTFPERIIYPFF